MECWLIQTGNEEIKGEQELVSMGYECRVFKSRKDEEVDTLTDEYCKYIHGNWHISLKSDRKKGGKESSLRDAFVRLLRTANIQGDYFLMGERDTTPSYQSHIVESLVSKNAIMFPDTEILRLSYNAWKFERDYSNLRYDSFPYSDLLSTAGFRCKGVTSGCHALCIPNTMPIREKIAKIFSTIPLPTDTALEYASAHGMIQMRSMRNNIFYQKEDSTR